MLEKEKEWTYVGYECFAYKGGHSALRNYSYYDIDMRLREMNFIGWKAVRLSHEEQMSMFISWFYVAIFCIGIILPIMLVLKYDTNLNISLQIALIPVLFAWFTLFILAFRIWSSMN